MVQSVIGLPPEPKFEAFPNRKYLGQSGVDTLEARSLESITSQVPVRAQSRDREYGSWHDAGKVLLLGEALRLDRRYRRVRPCVGGTVGIPVSAVGDSRNDAFGRETRAGENIERHTLFEHAQGGNGPTAKGSAVPSPTAIQDGDVVETVDAQALWHIEACQGAIFVLIVLILECG